MQTLQQISLTQVKDFSKKRNEPEWLTQKRIQAFEAFQKLPLLDLPDSPIEKNYTKLEGFDFSNYSLSSSSNLTVLNAEKLKKEGLIVETFSEALKNHPDVLQKYFLTSCVKPNENKATAFHSAFVNQLLFIIVPKNKQFSEPLHFQVHSNENQNAVLYSLLVIAEENSKLDIVEECISENPETNSLCSDTSEFFIQSNAQVSLSTLQYWSKESFGFSAKRAFVEKDAKMVWHTGNFGSKVFKQFTDTELIGQGSSLENFGFFLINGQQHYELVNNNWHKASKTSANAFNKGILNDRSVSVYKGLIKVDLEAKQVFSELAGHAVLLGSQARANALPALEIDNNDVLTKHAASVSQLDEKQIFYLMSRGFSASEAERLIVDGVFEQFLERIPSHLLVDKAKEIIEKEYSRNV
ncbi:MAG: Fe-S cluster assembly protein SufD [Candidatus Diapherotrites archaeon]|nr:Fe-S cluster assembly protein SufD [Candidatus Diapherotrites archaeon]